MARVWDRVLCCGSLLSATVAKWEMPQAPQVFILNLEATKDSLSPDMCGLAGVY